ncbi:D-alanyl-D-alanine carboxypeptidase/D-alanyl-D-alanine endopeptidase [Aquipuribacter nitratireducens]|uniref:D-alanyl-D-alanine carboxypeptidase/D-alanyl-D-alanine-endopeptidase n=1 Tax=Aquipuribacter nitratireducens TaxID=650104 RepID=A0ABW0GRJ6_9MICO
MTGPGEVPRRVAAPWLALLVAGGLAPVAASAPTGEPQVVAPPVERVVPQDPALDPAAPPPPDPAVLATSLAPLLADDALGPSPAVSVRDLATGAELAQRDSTTPVEPASTAKIVTAAAALDVLGADWRLVTRVGWVPATERGGDRPALVLVGGGDLLLAPGAGDPGTVDGRVGLGDLARSAVLAVLEGDPGERLLAPDAAGVDVLVDDSLLGAPQQLLRSPGDAFFAATPASLAVSAGRLGAGAGRDDDPAGTAALAFADAVEDELARVLGADAPAVGSPVVTTRPVALPVVVAEARSAPLADVLSYLLVTSDNTIADSVAGLVAAEQGRSTTLASASDTIVEVVEARGVDLGATDLTDGSGLSDDSVATAAGLTALLAAAAAAPDEDDLRLLPHLLPVAGLEGTLDDRFGVDSAAAAGRGVVRAKTGTLTGTTALAGVVTAADGRGLAFAVLTDEVPAGSTAAARRAVDRVAAAVAACC